MFDALRDRHLSVRSVQLCINIRMMFLFVLFIGFGNGAKAGPPMYTDDPGILTPGSWEVILAVGAEDCDEAKITHAPVLELSLGVTRNSQISLVLPYSWVNSASENSVDGLTIGSMGYKWRFFSNSTREWAIAANYTWPISHEVIEKNGAGDTRLLGIPLLMSQTVGEWVWNGQLGWNLSSDGERFWDYGVSVSHPLGSSAQWMMEVFGYSARPFKQVTVNYQLGLDFEISPEIHLLASAGSHLGGSSEPGAR